jgi:CRISPR-associated protein Cas1
MVMAKFTGMIKKTLYFGSPAYLKCRDAQLVVEIPHAQGIDKILNNTIPIEDVGVVILDNRQITLTHHLITRLMENNVALIHCDDSHLPASMMLNLSSNTLQSARFTAQINASLPLKKQLWQQTVRMKIRNQAQVLQSLNIPVQNMIHWSEEVRSGDPDNYEARAAAYYWRNVFPTLPEFKRERGGLPPNNLLNYTYALLRAMVARALVGSGLLPTLGIHHRNQYNAYCLADDIMEPYRPFADQIVLDILKSGQPYHELTKELKTKLLGLPVVDVVIDGKRSPLMVGVQRTSASLVECFEGVSRKISYPERINGQA